MKKTLLVLTLATTSILAGCGVQTSDNVNFEPEKLSYYQDTRVDKCFAVMATRKAFRFNSSGLGLTEVDCDEKVMNLIKNK